MLSCKFKLKIGIIFQSFGGVAIMKYQEQLKELGNIYVRSQKGNNEESFDRLLMELRKLSNNWHNLKKNNELSFPEYTQLIEKKYHLSESIQLRSAPKPLSTVSTASESPFSRLPRLEKNSQHTADKQRLRVCLRLFFGACLGVFATCIHSTFRLLATVFVRNPGWID
jgi:hypothetical protein